MIRFTPCHFTRNENHNALCHENAQAYTKKEIIYTCSDKEDTVRIFNKIFDTTFCNVPSFYLPKLPLESLMVFYFVSFDGDTVFCSEDLIDSLEEVLDFGRILGGFRGERCVLLLLDIVFVGNEFPPFRLRFWVFKAFFS